YIYTKTNGDKADFSRKSLEEYLDLYIKFKLKVQKAKEMQLDTIPSLKKELEGYRRQLADSYLIDKEVTEKLVREAYDRSQYDIDLSHILVSVDPDASSNDTLRAFSTIMKAKRALEAGVAWDSVALEYSTDRAVKRNMGHVGYVTALFPNGLYHLETAAYTQPTNKLIGPIRTKAGYHLLMTHDKRPARGEMEVAHILIRNAKDGESKDPKAIIDALYKRLQAGEDFEGLARAESEDKASAAKGGYIGFFGINRFERVFEDAAFALKNDGDYTMPFETNAGWHIIRRISKKEQLDYKIAKSGLQSQIKKDARFELAKKSMIERIKQESNFMAFNTTLENFIDTLTEDFLTYKWKAPAKGSEELLCAFGKDYKVTLGDFTEFLGQATRKRIQLGRGNSIEASVRTLYEDFIDQTALKYEERQLNIKYHDFKALMREYEEGILLFEATKILVWDKAAQDSMGLEEFFQTIKGRYRWEERATTSLYTLTTTDEEMLEKVRKFVAKNEPEKVLAKFNKDKDNPILIRTE
ncbi:MAG: peptidylprolyl isomerase, partial [Phaeodactylibacter sp.]|nr:peptidylprolyl isomerase [Phaeodactylibacter sp.]